MSEAPDKALPEGVVMGADDPECAPAQTAADAVEPRAGSGRLAT